MLLQMTIEVRPNPGSSKSNRLSAHSLSLEELLRYTDDDTKESAFEVYLSCFCACMLHWAFRSVAWPLDSGILVPSSCSSLCSHCAQVALFAEQFREMLETRCGRGLLRCLYILEKQVYMAWQMQCARRLCHDVAIHQLCLQPCNSPPLLQHCCTQYPHAIITGQRGEGKEGGGAKGTKGGRAKGT